MAGISDRDAANRFLRKTFLPRFNARFKVAPITSGSAFVPLLTTNPGYVGGYDRKQASGQSPMTTTDCVSVTDMKTEENTSGKEGRSGPSTGATNVDSFTCYQQRLSVRAPRHSE